MSNCDQFDAGDIALIFSNDCRIYENVHYDNEKFYARMSGNSKIILFNDKLVVLETEVYIGIFPFVRIYQDGFSGYVMKSQILKLTLDLF
jgi:hypothetical protein